MRSRCLGYIVAASLLLAQTAPPAFAQRRGATGPRGGSVHHSGGPRRGATTVRRHSRASYRSVRIKGGRARTIRGRGLLSQFVCLGWPSLLSPGVEREPDQRLRAAFRWLSRLACLRDLWVGK